MRLHRFRPLLNLKCLALHPEMLGGPDARADWTTPAPGYKLHAYSNDGITGDGQHQVGSVLAFVADPCRLLLIGFAECHGAKQKRET